MLKQTEKHQFSIFWQDLSKQHFKPQVIITINNADLYHRVTRVLRLGHGEQCILFDANKYLEVTLLDLDQKNILKVKVNAVKENQQLSPHITFLLPLLKREAFEDAIYNLVELGVNEIHLYIPQKVHRAWGGQRELDRLQKIMIAAAEQSKNYAMPHIHEPKTLSEVIENLDNSSEKLFFDPAGSSLLSVIKDYSKKDLILIVGPEGDLTEQEKMVLKENNVAFYRLTPTILRAQQAVVVAMGIMRSLF